MTEGSTSSSLTSTSHTLTQDAANNTNMTVANLTAGSPAVATLLDLTTAEKRHVFLQPPSSIPTGSLQLAKETLDILGGQVGDQQQARLREAGKKRKREEGRISVLKIRKLHVDGFETNQVWQQAKKIITGALEESARVVEELEELNEIGSEEDAVKAIEFGEDGFEVGSDEEDEESVSGSDGDEEGSGSESGSEADSEDADLSGEEDGVELDGEFSDEEGEEGETLFDDEAEEGEEDDEEEEDDDDEEDDGEELVEDPNGLNDGFFSLEQFNKQTALWEAQDARADPNTDANSDDESVDWHADPFSLKASKSKRKKGGDDDEEEESDIDMDDDEEEDDEDEDELSLKGKGKMDMEMDEDDGNDLGDLDDMGMDLTANDVYYKDFFAPPQRKKKTGNQRKPRGAFDKSNEKVDEADIERAENDVRRDLFEDDSERSDSEDALSDASAGNPKSRRSAHERRQAKIAEEIRKLEKELVAKRAWTLAGEAKATDRPKNSLLEEDLDFEHVGKPVPIMTEEVSETIEAMIKRRILAEEFDEVLRRRPDAFGNPDGQRRGLVDIEDTKAKKGLAEIYEEEHVKNANPDTYKSAADEKLSRDEKEIETMWKDVCAKLDALTSWHYKPKPAAPTLTVVADVATVAMEDAQPTTAQGVSGGESMMAPQEVYKPGKDTAEQGEVVTKKSGIPIAKQEMSREERTRRRRREKERIRKAGGVDKAAGKTLSRGAQSRKETMAELKKGGVRVINKKGETVGLDGKKVVENKAISAGGGYKL